MARRKRSDGEGISLFPFLSILACVIGVLTLMIAGLALSQMESDPNVAKLEELEKAKNDDRQEEEEAKILQAQVDRAESSADDSAGKLAEAQRKLQELMKLVDEEIKKNQAGNQPAPLIPEVDEDAHQKRMADLAKEMQELEDEIKRLQEELKLRDQPPEEAVVSIRPGGSGVDLKPTFVECTRVGLVLHTGDKPTRVRRADVASDKTWLELLDKIAKSNKGTVVFLIRDDAMGTYYAARNVALEKGARNGKLPVIGHGNLDLSVFENL